jgi:Uma2 family endonuclease
MAAARSLVPAVRPLLESGDRLTRAEFHRRYEQRPEIHKAELVEGVVYVPSPARAQYHGDPDAKMTTWLGTYCARNRGVEVSSNATVFLDADNELQPDICLRRLDGGTSRLIDGYIVGAPELVIEIAASTAAYDLHDKMNAYRRNGVQEYIVWRVLDGAIDWFELNEGAYVRLEADASGVIESHAFPGLRLTLTAMLDGDLEAVLAALG